MNKLLLSACLLLAGCATTENYNRKLDTWVGHPVNELFEAWGPPATTFENGLGMTMYTYIYNGGTTYNTLPNPYLNYTATYQTQNYCKTTFFVRNGFIKNWRWEGNSCRSE